MNIINLNDQFLMQPDAINKFQHNMPYFYEYFNVYCWCVKCVVWFMGCILHIIAHYFSLNIFLNVAQSVAVIFLVTKYIYFINLLYTQITHFCFIVIHLCLFFTRIFIMFYVGCEMCGLVGVGWFKVYYYYIYIYIYMLCVYIYCPSCIVIFLML